MAVASIEASDNEQYTMQDTMSNVQSRLQWAWNWWSYALLGTGYQLGIFFLTHLTILDLVSFANKLLLLLFWELAAA